VQPNKQVIDEALINLSEVVMNLPAARIASIAIFTPISHMTTVNLRKNIYIKLNHSTILLISDLYNSDIERG
jgi:hypothetical protein